jgi:hypothetical protein
MQDWRDDGAKAFSEAKIPLPSAWGSNAADVGRSVPVDGGGVRGGAHRHGLAQTP